MNAAATDDVRRRALALESAGKRSEARDLLEQSLDPASPDAGIANTAGNLAMRDSAPDDALRLFSLACERMPDALEYALNKAIALAALEKHSAVAEILASFDAKGRGDARYCSVRANSLRLGGDLAGAAEWYDRALALEPQHARALHGRARTALHRGEADALPRFDAALTANQAEADLWLGKAQALDVEGRSGEAREIMEQIAQQAPQWTEGLRFLAQLRLAEGEADWDTPFAEAAARLPGDAGIPLEHCRVLDSLDQFERTTEIAAGAAARLPEIEAFRLYEGMSASAAGDMNRAETAFRSLMEETPDRFLHEGRHRIRTGEIERAEELFQRCLDQEPWNIGAWALIGIVWRLRDDERAQWLHEQAGLVQLVPIVDQDGILAKAVPALHKLHDSSPFPLGQSLRGGTQTRGNLFERHEQEFANLHQAIRATLEEYRAALPATDEKHPLLRHRDVAWKVEGSWSVRLAGGGDYHTSHIHPQGIISSALYCELPDAVEANDQQGWLEIGRPPPDLRLDLPPLRTIQPRTGHLALFPSTLYHGTTPFGDARRMTVAFDVVPGAGTPA